MHPFLGNDATYSSLNLHARSRSLTAKERLKIDAIHFGQYSPDNTLFDSYSKASSDRKMILSFTGAFTRAAMFFFLFHLKKVRMIPGL